jgi:hypothetical protein
MSAAMLIHNAVRREDPGDDSQGENGDKPHPRKAATSKWAIADQYVSKPDHKNGSQLPARE